MKDVRINKSMAEIDGYILGEVVLGGARYQMSKNGEGHNTLPRYLTDHNAVQRVIDGLNDEECYDYLQSLSNGDDWGGIKATPRQKCEEILKAKGKWGNN